MTRLDLKALAQRGAAARFAEIQSELSALVQTFPELGPNAAPKGRTMSPAQRKAVSARMKAYWAKRRKAAGKAGAILLACLVPALAEAQTTPRPGVDCSLLTAEQARGLPCAAPVRVTAPPLVVCEDCGSGGGTHPEDVPSCDDLNPYAAPDRALACVAPPPAGEVPTFQVGHVYAYGYASVRAVVLGVTRDIDGVQVVTLRWLTEGTVSALRTPPTPGGATAFYHVGVWRQE